MGPQELMKIVAFGSTRRKDTKAKDDPQLQCLVASGAKNACIVAKGSLKHVTKILSTTAEENLEMIRDSVEFLKSSGLNVFVDLEHFYDGYLDDQNYSSQLISTCVDSGVSHIVLCDTNGGSLPKTISAITSSVASALPSLSTSPILGVHCHNDMGLSVANR